MDKQTDTHSNELLPNEQMWGSFMHAPTSYYSVYACAASGKAAVLSAICKKNAKS